MEKYDILKLENQICFPLYAASREVIKAYKEFLEPLGLTYTQYLVMMVMWDVKIINVKSLGERLFLDSGTLTPLLKKLETDGLVLRTRSVNDERVLNVELTLKGARLRDRSLRIPAYISEKINLSAEDAYQLYTLCYKILGNSK